MDTLLDLNIENYDLPDILNLFKIPENFNENDLKNAKKIVLKMHPDKSGLHANYFRFFSKAYKAIYDIWVFKNKIEKNLDGTISTEYIAKTEFFDKEKKKILDDFLDKEKKSEKAFNTWFNEQFEKNKVEREEEAHGYGNWLKSDEDLEDEKTISMTQLGEEIERKKQKVRALTVYKGIDDITANYAGVSNLTGDAPVSFGSDLFSSLQYEDLRKAHTETVVPVTLEDYNNVKKFNNVNEYTAHRNSQNIEPLSDIQAREYLSNKERYQEKESTERAYKLAQQLEETQKKQANYWASMRYINNK
jgi:hypothetical protein